MDEDLDAAQYDAVLERLVASLADEAGGPGDAVWDVAGEVVPELTEPVCRRILEHADADPDAALVEEVTSHRGSDDAELLRARALTVLVADLRARVGD